MLLLPGEQPVVSVQPPRVFADQVDTSGSPSPSPSSSAADNQPVAPPSSIRTQPTTATTTLNGIDFGNDDTRTTRTSRPPRPRDLTTLPGP
jgi:hypothetical protein